MSYQQGDNAIRCDVKNCVYNDEKRHCLAGQVEVGPQFSSSTAGSSAETICSTFRPK